MEKQRLFQVVTNLEGQYSIWPDNKAIPQGWKTNDVQGSKDHCLELKSGQPYLLCFSTSPTSL